VVQNIAKTLLAMCIFTAISSVHAIIRLRLEDAVKACMLQLQLALQLIVISN
jgi:hypothetical protein